MAAWLTKTRAILGLAAVMFVAALNRREPVVYAMAMMLATVGVLGYALPWLALRGVTLVPRAGRPEAIDAAEGAVIDLALELRHGGWWPAWMVEVQAEWQWAGRSFTSRDVAPVLMPGTRRPVLDAAAFACRGHYRLAHLRLRSGFPLGLVHAQREVAVPALSVRVHPAPTPLLPLPRWTVTEDVTGDDATDRAGESLELSMLRAYEPGESVRRVDWRASARAGALVVRQFQHPASVRVTVMVEPPSEAEVGRADAPGEQAMRVAASVCAALTRQGVHFRLRLPATAPAADMDMAARALAEAPPPQASWVDELIAEAALLRRGEQILAVLSPRAGPQAVTHAAHVATLVRARVLALVATWPGMAEPLHAQAAALVAALQGEGVEAHLAWT